MNTVTSNTKLETCQVDTSLIFVDKFKTQGIHLEHFIFFNTY
jgi:hypothetical protein